MFHEVNLATMFCFFFLEIFYYLLHQKIGKILEFFFFGHSANSSKVLENLAKNVYSTKLGEKENPA